MSKSSVKWLVRIGLWVWFGYWIAQIFIGDLGSSPAVKLNHEIGFIVLVVFTLNLLLGILLDIWKRAPAWLRTWTTERRFLGVSTFLFLLAHVFFYFVNEGFEEKAWEQLASKTYLTFALIAFWMMFALAVTSNNWSVRALGIRKWKGLHRLVYLVQLLLIGHILLIEKTNLVLYAPWLIALAILQGVRWILLIVHRSSTKS